MFVETNAAVIVLVRVWCVSLCLFLIGTSPRGLPTLSHPYMSALRVCMNGVCVRVRFRMLFIAHLNPGRTRGLGTSS